MSATVITDLAAELPLAEDGTLSRVLYRDDRLRVVGLASRPARSSPSTPRSCP